MFLWHVVVTSAKLRCKFGVSDVSTVDNQRMMMLRSGSSFVPKSNSMPKFGALRLQGCTCASIPGSRRKACGACLRSRAKAGLLSQVSG